MNEQQGYRQGESKPDGQARDVGGLTLSAMKRGLGAEDWGVMIESHGYT